MGLPNAVSLSPWNTINLNLFSENNRIDTLSGGTRVVTGGVVSTGFVSSVSSSEIIFI